MAQDGIPWAYASYLGAGRYSLDGGVDTTVISLAPGRVFREPGEDESGRRIPGYRLKVPLAIGAHEFAAVNQIANFDRDSINAISVVPGVEIEVAASERHSTKALVYLGYGREFRSNVDAQIFRLGFRSRLRFEFGETRMHLVNSLERIGFSADNGVSDGVNLLSTGLDFTRPLKNRKLGGHALAIHWHLMYTNYLDTAGLDLSRLAVRRDFIGSEWELGSAFSKQLQQIGFWRLKFDRIGLTYRFTADGEFSGIGINFRSLFDR